MKAYHLRYEILLTVRKITNPIVALLFGAPVPLLLQVRDGWIRLLFDTIRRSLLCCNSNFVYATAVLGNFRQDYLTEHLMDVVFISTNIQFRIDILYESFCNAVP